MAVPISSFLSKASGAIPFLLRDSDLRGGYRVVTTDADRDAIPVGARTVGMLVFVTTGSQFVQWDGSVWQPLDVTSMVSVGDGLTNGGAGEITIDQVRLAELFSSVDHNHEGVYAAANHDHATVYAPIDHTHTGFAATNHTHTEYAAADHDHDTDYAAANHDHATVYAPIDHTHTGFAAENHNHEGVYAPADHDHATVYAPIDHTHTGFATENHQHTFASLTEVPKVSGMPGVTISTTEPAPTDGEDGDIWFVVA